MNWLYRLTGWGIFRPSHTEWGECTELWSEVDWDWYRRRDPTLGVCAPPPEDYPR